MKYKKQNFSNHGETDKKNSWYWNVLVKNLGNWKRAEKEVFKSRLRVDPTFNE